MDCARGFAAAAAPTVKHVHISAPNRAMMGTRLAVVIRRAARLYVQDSLNRCADPARLRGRAIDQKRWLGASGACGRVGTPERARQRAEKVQPRRESAAAPRQPVRSVGR
jgi:hypothetical protein